MPETQSIQEKRNRLLEILSRYGSVAVAFSGGVDSTVVAQAAWLALGDRALAVTSQSASLAAGELELTRQLASQIGIPHRIITTGEFADPRYVANPPNRCYFCKSELYSQLTHLRAELNFAVIVNGANTDDRGDHRPGMHAAREAGVRSPLIEAGLDKASVRELAKGWGLPVWDKPAAPCLSSRIAYGVAVTPERVRRVDAAERWLREQFRLRELRVRIEPGEHARVEVPLNEVPRVAAATDEITRAFVQLGFASTSVDPAGFRSGSMNERLAPAELVTLSTEF